jgi:hypothetical protein
VRSVFTARCSRPPRQHPGVLAQWQSSGLLIRWFRVRPPGAPPSLTRPDQALPRRTKPHEARSKPTRRGNPPNQTRQRNAAYVIIVTFTGRSGLLSSYPQCPAFGCGLPTNRSRGVIWSEMVTPPLYRRYLHQRACQHAPECPHRVVHFGITFLSRAGVADRRGQPCRGSRT